MERWDRSVTDPYPPWHLVQEDQPELADLHLVAVVQLSLARCAPG